MSMLNLVFKEAVKFIKGKKTLLKEEYEALEDECRARAFTVSGYTKLEIIQKFKELLTLACEDGKTKEEFMKEMNSFLKDNGYTEEKKWRLENIFRTNVQTAFQVGHYKSMTEDKTMQLRPYWQYVTAEDGHVRDTHAAMNRKVFRADDPIWDVWYPPNGFGCRCTVISLSKKQLETRGLSVEKEVPYSIDPTTGEILPVFPDKGFSSNPAKAVWKPDLSSFDAEIKDIYYSQVAK